MQVCAFCACYSLMFGADQVGDWFVARNKSGVQGVSRKKISIARTQSVDFVTHAQLKYAGQYPMRLILSVGVRAILCSRRVAPLKYTVAFFAQTRFQLLRVW